MKYWLKAGSCAYEDKKVVSDPRKGLLELEVEDDEGGLNFVRWFVRDDNDVASADPEEERIVMNDAYLKLIKSPKDQNLLCLKFTTCSEIVFFWLQELDHQKIKAFMEVFNNVVCKLPEAQTSMVAAAKLLSVETTELSNQAAVSSTSVPNRNEEADAFRNLAERFAREHRPASVNVSQLLTPDAIQAIVNDTEAMKDLRGLMPEGQQTDADVKDALRTSQFQASVSHLNQALQSDQLELLLANLQLDGGARITADMDGVDALVAALDASMSPESRRSQLVVRGAPDGEREVEPPSKVAKTDEDDQPMENKEDE